MGNLRKIAFLAGITCHILIQQVAPHILDRKALVSRKTIVQERNGDTIRFSERNGGRNGVGLDTGPEREPGYRNGTGERHG